MNWWRNDPRNEWQLATALPSESCTSCGSDVPPGDLLAAYMHDPKPDWLPSAGWLCMTCVAFMVRLGEVDANLRAHIDAQSRTRRGRKEIS